MDFIRRKSGMAGIKKHMPPSLLICTGFQTCVLHFQYFICPQVYIIRSQGSDEMDGALSLLELDSCRYGKDGVDGAVGKCGMAVLVAFCLH